MPHPSARQLFMLVLDRTPLAIQQTLGRLQADYLSHCLNMLYAQFESSPVQISLR